MSGNRMMESNAAHNGNTAREEKRAMKRLVRLFVLLAVCLFPFGQSSFAGDFSNVTTSSRSLFFKDNNGKALKTITTKSTDRSLSGTGLSGTVTDGGDHWIVNVTGGILYGTINTEAGLEIRLLGSQAGISTTRSTYAINGGGGVRICGPGMLHIDQHATSAAIYAGSGNIAITGGAVVGVNGLGVTSAAVSGPRIRVQASALHVNSVSGKGLYCRGGGLTIGESIVTVCASKTALLQRGTNEPISVAGSCVHLISGNSSAIQCGDTDFFPGANSVSVGNSVFCALGAGHGIQGRLSGLGTSMAFNNVVGVIAGRNCGIYAASRVAVSGGSTKLSIAGNIDGHHTPGDTTAIDYLQSNNSSGQGIRSQSPSQAYFGLQAGNVKLFSPGVCALDCGTNAVTGGKLEIPAKATYSDFRTLFTWQGAISAAEIFMGRSLFQSDTIYADFDIVQAFAGVIPASTALFSLSDAKPRTGVSADMFYVTGGEVSVAASGVGIHLGGCYSSRGAYLTQKGGRIAVEASRIAIADDDAVDGYVSGKSKNSGIWLTGGKLTARGGWDGILTCGYVLQEGGTIEAAATGGYAAGTISADPGLRGYALSANYGFGIVGGSFVASAGALRTSPNATTDHGSAPVYPCDLAVSGTSANSAIAVSSMTPSWYGTNDLYPIGGILRFWLPAGAASLKYGNVQYTANGTGRVVAGSNRFLSGPAVTLSGLSISGAASVASGGSATYTCKATYSDGTGKTVSPTWSIHSGSSYGKISSSGTFTANATTVARSVTLQAAFGGKTATKTVTITASASPSATLTLGASSRSFTADAASGKELAVAANVSWTAKSSASWLAVKTASGKGNGTIVYNVAANTGSSQRTGTITVAGGGLTRTFTVTQSGKGSSGGTATLTLGASSRTFTADAASGKELAVAANVSWTAKSSASWLTVKTASGKGNGTIVYNVAANTGSSQRTGAITVAGGGLTRTFTVTQNGKGSGGGTATLTLGASSRSFTADAAGGKELAVTANVSWTAKASASWLTVKTASGKGNGKIVYNVAANTGRSSRSAGITVSGGGLTRTFVVSQSGKDSGGGTATLTLGSSSRSFTAAAADSKELAVTANVPWTAKSSVSWLAVKTSSGKGNGKIIYNVAANTGSSTRTGTITVTGGGLVRSFTVAQAGKGGGGGSPTLTLGATSRTFTSAAANSKELAVKANVSWKAMSSASWLKVKTSSGKGNAKIVYNVAAYKGTGSRTGLIMVSGGGKTASCSIIQLGGTPNLRFYQPSGWPAAMFVTTHESNTTTRTSFVANTNPLVCVRWAWDNNGNTTAPMHKFRFAVTGPDSTSTDTTVAALDTTHYRFRHLYYGLVNSSGSVYAAPARTGVYTATVTLDPGNEIPETNESDNTRSVTFSVVARKGLDKRAGKAASDGGPGTAAGVSEQVVEPAGDEEPDNSLAEEEWLVVTTSDNADGGVLLDGDEGTGWGLVGEDGGWVVLSYSEAIDVKGVTVKGEGLPEDGVRVLLSEDADDWREECEGRAQYVWVVVPEGAAGARLTEILVEEE